MNYLEVIRFINDIEKRFPVAEWTSDDINIWPLIRVSLGMQLYRKGENLYESPKESKEKSIFSKFAKRLSYLYDCYRAVTKDKKLNANPWSFYDAVFFTGTADLIKIGDVWYNRICGPIIDRVQELKIKCMVYECHNYFFRYPRYHSSFFLQPRIDFLKVKAFLNSKKGAPKNLILPQWENFKRFLATEGFESFIDEKRLFFEIEFIKKLADYFGRLLTINKPKVVFVVCYYDYVGMALCLAGKRRGIPVVDVQHGVQHEAHVAYGRWVRVPPEGYDLLPDYFWVWGKEEAKVINEWAEGTPHKTIVGGNWWLELWKEGTADFVRVYRERINGLVPKKAVNILFTLQTNFEPPEWLFRAIELSPANWRWWIRLHPGMMQMRRFIKDLFSRCDPSKYEIDQASDLPLLAWLNHIDIHVTLFSSVVLEAECFGVPSIVIHPTGAIYYEKQIKRGTACFASNEDELIEAIHAFLRKKGNLQFASLGKIEADSILKHFLS